MNDEKELLAVAWPVLKAECPHCKHIQEVEHVGISEPSPAHWSCSSCGDDFLYIAD